jgi:hypothetical protein
MSLKTYTRKSKDLIVRMGINNVTKKKNYKKFYNRYNRRKTREEIKNIMKEVLV